MVLVRLHVGVECGAGISGEDVGVEPGVECKVGLFVNGVWAYGFGRQMGQIDGYDVVGVAGLECSFAVFIEDVIRGGNEVGEVLGQAVGIADGSERANMGHRWEKNKPTVRRIKHAGALLIAAPKLAAVERSCTRGRHEPDRGVVGGDPVGDRDGHCADPRDIVVDDRKESDVAECGSGNGAKRLGATGVL